MRNAKLGRSKWSAFLSGKGFYVAICLCAVMVSAAAYFMVDATRNGISAENEAKLSLGTDEENRDPPNSPVEQIQKDVPKEDDAQKPVEEPAELPEGDKSGDVTTAAPEQSFSNTFFMPLQGEILCEYSGGKPVKSKTMNDWRTHDGVDIQAEIATPVKSASDGIVTAIEQDPMWGVVITVDHGNGYQSFYMGLNVNVNVKKDQRVEIGTVLGSVGQTAEVEISEPPHLHFAMKKDGEWIDPIEIMQNA